MPGNKQSYTPPAGTNLQFEASHKAVVAGRSVTLTWSAPHARRLYINGDEVPNEGHREEIIKEDRKFKLELNGKGVFRDQKQVVVIETPEPVIKAVRFPSELIQEKKPLEIHLDLQYCSHWTLEATYLTGNRQPVLIASGENKDHQSDWQQQAEVFLQAACSIVCTAYNGKKKTSSSPFYLDIAKPLITDFASDKVVVVHEGHVHLNWQTEHTHKLLLQPGNHDVTGLTSFDYPCHNRHDKNITLLAYGDFGQQVTQSVNLWVAWLGDHRTSNNGQPADPQFYLDWSDQYVDHVTLHPGGLPANGGHRIAISARETSESCCLQGVTTSGDTIKYPFTLYAAEIMFFEASRSSAIIGTKLYLRWRVVNARKVVFDHGIGIQTGQEETPVTMQAGMEKITMTVWGDTNVVTQTILIPLLKGPEITRINLPLPELSIQLNLPRPVALPHAAQPVARLLDHQYKQLHPLLRAMVTPSTVGVQVLRRQWWPRHGQKQRVKQASPGRFLVRQLHHLLTEWRFLITKIKYSRYDPKQKIQ